MKSRTYDSPTRKAQAEETRRRILRSLVELLMEERPATVSIPQVAQRAGVSVRIVYHYFPTKDALFDAVIDEVQSIVVMPEGFERLKMDSPAALVAGMPAAFDFLDLNRAVFRAVSMSELRERLDARRRPERIARMDAALQPLAPRLDEREQRELRAIVGLLTSFEGFDALTTTWGLSNEEAADAVAWATRILTDRARRSGVGQ